MDFVLAHPQDDVECDLDMKPPKRTQTSTGDSKTHVLLLKKKFACPIPSQEDLKSTPSEVTKCDRISTVSRR